MKPAGTYTKKHPIAVNSINETIIRLAVARLDKPFLIFLISGSIFLDTYDCFTLDTRYCSSISLVAY